MKHGSAAKGLLKMKAKDIGAAVRALRMKAGLSTTALAKKIGLSQVQVSRLETGRQGLRVAVLLKMAKALKVPPFRFLMTGAEWAKWTGRR